MALIPAAILATAANAPYVSLGVVGCGCLDLDYGGPALVGGARADAALALGRGLHLGVRGSAERVRREHSRVTTLHAGALFAGRWGDAVTGGFTIALGVSNAYRAIETLPGLFVDVSFDLGFRVAPRVDLFADTYAFMLRTFQKQPSARGSNQWVYTNVFVLPAVVFGVRVSL